jgi:serine/threonine protein kinase
MRPVHDFKSGAVTVQRCRDEATEATFIRKAAALRDVHARNRLRQEYAMLRRVHAHGDAPHVTRPLQLIEADGMCALHLVDIGGRAVWQAGKRHKSDLVTAIARQVCKALTSVHSAGLLYCDVNPRNIVQNEAGHVELIDFELARVMPAGADATHWRADVFAQAFAAPEQTEYFDAPLGVWTDLYGLGATLYTLLAGAPPFSGRKILEAAAFRPATALALVAPETSEELARVVDTLLLKLPTKRMKSSEAVLAAL